MIKAIVGANWGDEGKGKITDMLAQESDIIIRYQGGSNAGHTIINNYGKFALHLLPSGVFYDHTVNILGNGVAFNIKNFLDELSALVERGVPAPKLLVSNRAHILMPYHILFDKYEEERLADRQFGSTKSGIAPFYSDKYAKTGIPLCDLFGDEEVLFNKIKDICKVKNILLTHLYNKPTLDPQALFDELISYREPLRPYVCDTVEYLRGALAQNKRILLEGQLGALRDLDHGIYPYTTSSSTLAGFGTVGAGLPPQKFEEIIAVVKAYSSCVGEGPFVSEIFGDEATDMRNHGGDGGEFGATTGRPRRMGWFDAVATRYGCHVQGATSIALAVIDALGYLDELKVCIGYEVDGEVIDYFPISELQYKAKPVYKTLKGWKTNLTGIRSFADLPAEAQEYVRFIEEQVGVPVKYLSNGPKREDVILM